MTPDNMRIALLHDYLREYGGAERVLEQLHQIYPQAPVYTAFMDKDALGKQVALFADWDIRETDLTKLPFYKKLFSPYRVFAAWAWRRLNLDNYDLVISSTNAYLAKAVEPPPTTKHLSYIHTPPRALYGYTTRTNWQSNPLIKFGGRLINTYMRQVDFQSAQRPDVLIANSRTTAQRIKKFYRRDSVIIPPPVKLVDEQQRRRLPIKSASDRQYLLFVSRLVLSKHPEIAVQISNDTGWPLKIVGTGVMEPELRAQAGPQVEFLGAVDDDQLLKIYQNAKLLLYPAEDEDFGIVPIEAMALGTPVLAHYSGEPRYTIKPGFSGDHVRSLETGDWLTTAKKRWSQSWQSDKIAKEVKQYSSQEFTKKIQQLVAKTVRQN